MEVQIQHGCWKWSPDFPPKQPWSLLLSSQTHHNQLIQSYQTGMTWERLTNVSSVVWMLPADSSFPYKGNIFRLSGVLPISIVRMSPAVASHIPRRLRLELEMKDFSRSVCSTERCLTGFSFIQRAQIYQCHPSAPLMSGGLSMQKQSW